METTILSEFVTPEEFQKYPKAMQKNNLLGYVYNQRKHCYFKVFVAGKRLIYKECFSDEVDDSKLLHHDDQLSGIDSNPVTNEEGYENDDEFFLL